MSESQDLSFSVSAAELEHLDAGVLVIGVHSADEGPVLAHNPLDTETAEGLEAILEDLGVTGAADELKVSSRKSPERATLTTSKGEAISNRLGPAAAAAGGIRQTEGGVSTVASMTMMI